MKNILLATIPALLVWFSTYAIIPSYTPEQLAERQNKQAIKQCIESISYEDTVNQVQRALETCKELELIQVITPKTNTWTLATGSTVAPSIKFSPESESMDDFLTRIDLNLTELHKKVCKKQINSPLCNDRKLFYPILLGITNAESSLWLNFSKDRVWWTCAWRNNWGWIKWRKTDSWESVKDQKIPDKYGCYLYKFESIEDYWISKVNTIRFWYKGCIDSKAPIRCLSYAYVWDWNVAEESWISNVSIFLD